MLAGRRPCADLLGLSAMDDGDTLPGMSEDVRSNSRWPLRQSPAVTNESRDVLASRAAMAARQSAGPNVPKLFGSRLMGPKSPEMDPGSVLLLGMGAVLTTGDSCGGAVGAPPKSRDEPGDPRDPRELREFRCQEARKESPDAPRAMPAGPVSPLMCRSRMPPGMRGTLRLSRGSRVSAEKWRESMAPRPSPTTPAPVGKLGSGSLGGGLNGPPRLWDVGREPL